MDGNGRWAEDRGLPRTEGHQAGVKAIKPIIKACAEKKIPALSVWAFSQDNWARPVEEVDFLLQLFIQSLEKEVEELHNHGICLRFTGDRSNLSESLRKSMVKAESLTSKNKITIFNVVINYTGRWDVLQAAKNIAQKVASGEMKIDDVSEQVFSEQLSTSDLPDPDLFIRTSGEKRISNFFLWQLAYTELYFTETSWPDFNVLEFEKALKCFSLRERRFGKISDQLIGEHNV
jgi:undecaprenyl diphosphate synthase